MLPATAYTVMRTDTPVNLGERVTRYSHEQKLVPKPSASQESTTGARRYGPLSPLSRHPIKVGRLWPGPRRWAIQQLRGTGETGQAAAGVQSEESDGGTLGGARSPNWGVTPVRRARVRVARHAGQLRVVAPWGTPMILGPGSPPGQRHVSCK